MQVAQAIFTVGLSAVLAAAAVVLGVVPALVGRLRRAMLFLAGAAAVSTVVELLRVGGSVSFPVETVLGSFALSATCLYWAGWAHCSSTVLGLACRRGDHLRARALSALSLVAWLPALTLGGDATQGLAGDASGTPWQASSASSFNAFVLTFLLANAVTQQLQWLHARRMCSANARRLVVGGWFCCAALVHDLGVVAGVTPGPFWSALSMSGLLATIVWHLGRQRQPPPMALWSNDASPETRLDDALSELAVLRQRLTQADRLAALGRLSAGIGHEINNPLTYITGNLSFLRGEVVRKLPDDPALEEAVADALDGAEQIRCIVRELKGFSDAPDVEEQEIVDVQRVLQSALKLCQGAFDDRIEVRVELDGVAPVRADPTKLSQVFVNLLTNAAQASVDCPASSQKPVVVVRTRALDNDGVCVEVLDSGPGITDEQQKRIFEPFYSTKGRDKGTGLGLFISLGIVTSLGGSIEMNRRSQGGTCASVRLPGCLDGLPRAPSSRPPMSHVVTTRRPQRLLIVDDDQLVGRALARQLSDFQVQVVLTGGEAVDRLLAESEPDYDWVLCDLMMPDKSGMEVYEQVVSARPELAKRFVFLSGGFVTDEARQFAEQHSEQMMSKPLDPRRLEQMLQAVEPRHSQAG